MKRHPGAVTCYITIMIQEGQTYSSAPTTTLIYRLCHHTKTYKGGMVFKGLLT